MTAMSERPTAAADILRSVGVEEDADYYGPYTSEVEKCVLTVPQRIMAAWLANDANAFADVFTENGSLLMQDTQLTSREEIRSFMDQGFRGPFAGAHVVGGPVHLEFLSADVAMVITQGGIVLSGESTVSPDREIRAIWIVVDCGDEWKLMSHQSSPIKG